MVSDFQRFIYILETDRNGQMFANLLAELLKAPVMPRQEHLKLRVVLQLVNMFDFKAVIFNHNPDVSQSEISLEEYVNENNISEDDDFQKFVERQVKQGYTIRFENRENEDSNPRTFAYPTVK